MPDLGPLGRGGARRRTRRRMTAVNSAANQKEDNEKQDFAESGVRENSAPSIDTAEKLEKLAKLLIDKGVITQSEFDLLFR